MKYALSPPPWPSDRIESPLSGIVIGLPCAEENEATQFKPFCCVWNSFQRKAGSMYFVPQDWSYTSVPM